MRLCSDGGWRLLFGGGVHDDLLLRDHCGGRQQATMMMAEQLLKKPLLPSLSASTLPLFIVVLQAYQFTSYAMHHYYFFFPTTP